MVCVILAAGYATRLYPLTENFPKPLLEVNGKTILDWLIDDLAATNKIDNFVVVSNHRYFEHFEKWKSNKVSDTPIVVLDDGTTSNSDRLGAVRDIQFAIETLKIKDDVIVIAGDNVLDFSFSHFISYFEAKQASCVMRYFEESVDKLKKCGVAEIDADELITEAIEKPAEPKSNWALPPFYIYCKNDLHQVKKGIEKGAGVDAPGSFVAYLCKESNVYAMEMPGERYDIGDLASYNEVSKTYKGIITPGLNNLEEI